MWNAVGPLQLVNCVIQNCHVREQKSLGEDKQRKISLKMKKAFWSSCPSTSLALHWAWQFFYHVNDFCKELVGSGLNGLNFWSRSNEPNTMQQDVGLTYWGRFKRILENDIPWLTGGYAGAGAIWFCAIMLGSQQQQSWLREHCDVHGPMQLPWQGTISILLSLVNL